MKVSKVRLSIDSELKRPGNKESSPIVTKSKIRQYIFYKLTLRKSHIKTLAPTLPRFGKMCFDAQHARAHTLYIVLNVPNLLVVFILKLVIVVNGHTNYHKN